MKKSDRILPDLSKYKVGNLSLRFTNDPEDIEKTQKLRYRSFFLEQKEVGNTVNNLPEEIDADKFDYYCDHLIVIDESAVSSEKVVGTYRFLRKSYLTHGSQFYTQTEFDISSLLNNSSNALEVGRSCVHPAYRNGLVIQLLWRGIAEYISAFGIDYIFGCASLPGNDPKKHLLSLSYLFNYHLAPQEICPKPLEKIKADIDILPKELIDKDKKRAFVTLPPLIKGYLRIGGMVGNGAIIDNVCNTTDVCMIVDTRNLAQKYSNKFTAEKQVSENKAEYSFA
ncbi:MAG: GNAT family N-acetyltransferase [Alphaproteobacteria bacterium]|jgi:putative hemolysin